MKQTKTRYLEINGETIAISELPGSEVIWIGEVKVRVEYSGGTPEMVRITKTIAAGKKIVTPWCDTVDLATELFLNTYQQDQLSLDLGE